ncbi:UDP-N-acetylmuramoyl-L-alanine--D-glutamate ligase [Candidatus Falkowbacteria bacterium CG10_big_fil_rev_8_21_14_0_10_37_14]|uniref:UDP-N-acetylmuramoylalanine--D-glutamate ligase n=1 Tax=Candidatus Falkowbacteria bacterium CG10_big_fil_rev_8_21_14_0_10_37_14 TaxID=1974561 RepID=A0A2M6WTD1_9BACT|nr:UDP-N-acetylmuramoyl-L-alanine--D-glutamate ligase [Candidatus Falkowbacteria bacterium]PIT96059.1 MAG: UDP-N-acetylmuramoyl-L-alanine--D-glutamate ligase [Candidatus Falkowbacteria bacterium CG10_big_fil_rev_8_21_14_0_10_37_14]
MTIKDLHGRRLGILGLGLENYWLIKWLIAHKIHGRIIICDLRDITTLGEKFVELNKYEHITWQLGKEFNQNLDRYDILFRAPGWPLSCPGIAQGLKKNKKIVVTSPMKLFFDVCPTKNIIGVTGSKGKGTTSSLIFDILKTAKKRVWLGGNIGVAPFSFIDKIKAEDFVILELSSFQLEDLHRSPKVAVLTNFTPEHLAPADPNNPNFHPSLAHYWISKFNIAKWQSARDYFVVNEKLKLKLLKWEMKFGKLKQRVSYFGVSDLTSGLPGQHNRENVDAAEVVAKLLKIEPKTIAIAVKKFKGLPHRLELVAEKNNIKYYDDSFATTPESTIIALKSFEDPIVLLAGGADKQADFKNLAKEINKRAKFVVLLNGTATARLRKEIIANGFSAKKIKLVKSMDEAVMTARDQSERGDVILMSTACASFGMFKNYKDRGEQFVKLARN